MENLSVEKGEILSSWSGLMVGEWVLDVLEDSLFSFSHRVKKSISNTKS